MDGMDGGGWRIFRVLDWFQTCFKLFSFGSTHFLFHRCFYAKRGDTQFVDDLDTSTLIQCLTPTYSYYMFIYLYIGKHIIYVYIYIFSTFFILRWIMDFHWYILNSLYIYISPCFHLPPMVTLGSRQRPVKQPGRYLDRLISFWRSTYTWCTVQVRSLARVLVRMYIKDI